MRDRHFDELLGPPRSTAVAFEALMPHRVTNLLLVSSLYDFYAFVEDGRLSEILLAEFVELNLTTPPSIERVSSAEEALALLGSSTSIDLVIATIHVGVLTVGQFCAKVKAVAPRVPVVVLASNPRELELLEPLVHDPLVFRVFAWQGDVRLFLAIIKLVEDWLNAPHDVRSAGVSALILVEDSVRFYSSYLPMLYTEVVRQTQLLMTEGVNRMQQMVRMRARPKILLATTFEEGVQLFKQYRDNLIGVITDMSFPRKGARDRVAGKAFAKMVRRSRPDVPVLVQSGSADLPPAMRREVAFVRKDSTNLLAELRNFMRGYLGFGDFVFRTPDGTMVSRATDLLHLEWAIQAAPAESLIFHASRNDFSTWLLARTEFALAGELRPRGVSDFEDAEELRRYLLDRLKENRRAARAGVVAEFSQEKFESIDRFVRIGTGSLGGKGRGLAFVNSLMDTYGVEDHFEGIRISVPATVVLATDIFDQFVESAGLLGFALDEDDDDEITRAFLEAQLPSAVVESLWTFLDWVRYPLAVRSSSLLEDASYQPFAGVYQTHMIPNNHPDPEVRLQELCRAIKRVYASTYYSGAKAYVAATPNRLEEEQMAVIVQKVVGRKHEHFLYPDFAGVARSLNVYPAPGTRPEDGVAAVALGLGKTVVDGGRCARFCPAHPRKPIHTFGIEEQLENAQRQFLALDLESTADPLVSLDLETARRHGTLAPVGSVYSPDNNAVYDGIGRKGIPLVTLAGVLKRNVFPLPDVLSFLLNLSSVGTSCPVELEFAVNLSDEPSKPHQFGFLQLRPLVYGSFSQDMLQARVPKKQAICIAHQAMGDGLVSGLCDLVYVRRDTFRRAATPEVAAEIAMLDEKMRQSGRHYVLIGPGRWGSSDRWLGIPVRWAQLSSARCIVETPMRDLVVEPSQGSHFFQNLMSFGVGYLTLVPGKREDHLDYEWLDAQTATTETTHLRHLSFPEALVVGLNGRKSYGFVLKPGCSLGEST